MPTSLHQPSRRNRRPRADRRRRLRRDVRGLDRRPRRLLGRAGASGSTGSRPTPGSRTPRFDYHDVSIKWFEDGVLNVAANCIDRHLADPRRADRDHLGVRRPGRLRAASATASSTRRSAASPTSCTSSASARATGSCIYLPMIPQAAYAMLACARIGAIHSIVFAGFSADALRSRIDDSGARLVDHRRRGAARRPPHPAQDQRRQGARWPARRAPARRPPHRRRRRPGTPAATIWLHEDAERRRRRLPARADGRRGPALHPLHLGLDRPAQGRRCTPPAATSLYAAMTHQYVFDYHDGRHLLVHRRRRLGHRPQLHRLRPARERRHHADVRGRPDLARRRPLLAGLREAQGQHLLHRAHRDPRADGPGPRVGRQARPLAACASSARSASRSTPRPGTGTTRSSATTAARSSTPGGRPRPAAS